MPNVRFNGVFNFHFLNPIRSCAYCNPNIAKPPGQSVRKSLVFQAPETGDLPPQKKKAKRTKKSKKKASAPKKKSTRRSEPLPEADLAADLDSVLLQWKRKVPALRGLSASEAATILKKEVQQFEAMSQAKTKKLVPKLHNALVELSSSLQAANDLAVERDPEVLRCEWINKLKDEIAKLQSKRAATSTTTFSPSSFVGSFINARKKSRSPPGHGSHPLGDKDEAGNGEYVVSSSSSDEESGLSSAFEQSDTEPPAASSSKSKEKETAAVAASSSDPSLSNPLSMTAENRAELKFVCSPLVNRFCDLAKLSYCLFLQSYAKSQGPQKTAV